MEPRKFYRSSTNRVIAGVASGLAEYFNIDPVLVRLLFVIFTLVGGGGLLVYIIFWIAIPERPADYGQAQASTTPKNDPPMENQEKPYEPEYSTSGSAPAPPAAKPGKPEKKYKGSLVGGLVLITLGALFLLDDIIPNIDFGDLWPVILIVIGAGLLINVFGFNRKENQ